MFKFDTGLSDSDFINKTAAVKKKCQYQTHFCDGRYIGEDRTQDKEPCKYFKGGKYTYEKLKEGKYE